MAGQLFNPVFNRYFADPFAFRVGATYYAVGTPRDEGDFCRTSGRVVPMIKSHDLQNWQPVKNGGYVLTPPDSLRGGLFWAPEIATDGQRFYMYYHPGKVSPSPRFEIRCAVADHPEGPYTDTGRAMTDMARNPFAIDAHVFRDSDGQRYMYYATDFPENGDGYFRGTGLVVDRMTSMTTLEGNPRVVMRAKWPWQIFQKGRDIYGRVADWYTLEGPTVVKRFGKYFCFYSGGCYENDSYGVDYLVADHPMGPWREVGPLVRGRGPQVIRTMPGVIGPGHNSLVTTADGADYFVYHAWNQGMTERQMWADPVVWTPNGPLIERFFNYIAQKNAEAAPSAMCA